MSTIKVCLLIYNLFHRCYVIAKHDYVASFYSVLSYTSISLLDISYFYSLTFH